MVKKPGFFRFLAAKIGPCHESSHLMVWWGWLSPQEWYRTWLENPRSFSRWAGSHIANGSMVRGYRYTLPLKYRSIGASSSQQLFGWWLEKPLWKIWVRQLGWWRSQYFWENAKFMATKPPTSSLEKSKISLISVNPCALSGHKCSNIAKSKSCSGHGGSRGMLNSSNRAMEWSKIHTSAGLPGSCGGWIGSIFTGKPHI